MTNRVGSREDVRSRSCEVYLRYGHIFMEVEEVTAQAWPVLAPVGGPNGVRAVEKHWTVCPPCTGARVPWRTGGSELFPKRIRQRGANRRGLKTTCP